MSDNAFTVRHDLRPGDIGWVIERHGAIYAKEHGWDHRFEAYVAEAIAGFALRHDGESERLWIAERFGRPVGSIAIVNAGDDVAQLRWFLIEPFWRGVGLGRRMFDDALAFCRERGHRRVFLWTVAGLDAAAHVYTAAGFRLVESRPGRPWGFDVVEEKYELEL